MLRRLSLLKRPAVIRFARHFSDDVNRGEDANFNDEIDKILYEDVLDPPNDLYYPKLEVSPYRITKPLEGHNLVVLQPWVAYANFGESTNPELQLQECVSLGNTIANWNVVAKKIIMTTQMNRKTVLGPRSFEDLKDWILSQPGVSAVLFGVELLSGVQLATLEKELRMPVYDRFTVVLNIFRQHARTKEAKIQLALAELPYIRSHLREIHESSEYSSASESLKLLVGGIGERFYHQRLEILKRRERKLKHLLNEIRTRRELHKRNRTRDVPIVSVVGYTNSGKTSLVKYLSADEDLIPKDQLFATLDVSSHYGQLPSHKTVMYLDTVGFISRIPLLLVEAFSATLKDCRESDLIVHILDVSHPDHKLQYETVMKALELLQIPKRLLKTKLTIGNKIDLLESEEELPKSLPKCDLHISVTKNTNLKDLVSSMDNSLLKNLNHNITVIRLENGGAKYGWLRKNTTILSCDADEKDPNYLICRVIMSPMAAGRWRKQYGEDGILSDVQAFRPSESEMTSEGNL